MLTVDQIREIAKANGIEVTNRWEDSTKADVAPKLLSMSLRFTREAPDAWETLMSNHTQVEISLWGTRMCTGSGATDGSYYKCYEARRAAVNEKRALLGLSRTY